MFHTENAKMLPVFCLNLLCLACGRMLPPMVGGVQGWSQESQFKSEYCAETPHTVHTR